MVSMSLWAHGNGPCGFSEVEAMETLERVPTNLLRPGDVVIAYGMRVLLDTPAKVFHPVGNWCDHGPIVTAESCDVAYSWVGTVTNVSEVKSAGVVPTGWMHHYSDNPDEYRWNVQGNHLAEWTVERQS